jgi:oligopeptide/dipeptide ABC transporter ATP-binding protein
VASYFCDRIGVMYRGELMEEAPAKDLYRTAVHPYTKLLFRSAEEQASGESVALQGEVRAVTEAKGGCPFAARCPIADERCYREHPEYRLAGNGHRVRCFKVE